MVVQALGEAHKQLASMREQRAQLAMDVQAAEARLAEAVEDGDAAKAKLAAERENSATLERARAAAIEVPPPLAPIRAPWLLCPRDSGGRSSSACEGGSADFTLQFALVSSVCCKAIKRKPFVRLPVDANENVACAWAWLQQMMSMPTIVQPWQAVDVIRCGVCTHQVASKAPIARPPRQALLEVCGTAKHDSDHNLHLAAASRWNPQFGSSQLHSRNYILEHSVTRSSRAWL